MKSRFLQGIGQTLNGIGKVASAVVTGAGDASLTLLKGGAVTVIDVVTGRPLEAVGSVLDTAGRLVITGVETGVDVFTGTVDTLHGGMNTVKGAHCDVNQAAGNLGEAIAGPTGRKISDLMTWRTSRASGHAENDDDDDDTA